MMASSHTFQPDDSLPHPPTTLQQQQLSTKQAVIYNKSGTKCRNIVKEQQTPLSPTCSPPCKDSDFLPIQLQQPELNGTTKRKKKKKAKRKHSHTDNDHSHTYLQQTEKHNNVVLSADDHEELEEDCEDFSDDDGYDPEAPEIPFPRRDSASAINGDSYQPPQPGSKRKKKRKKNKNNSSINDITTSNHHNNNHKPRKDGIWNTNNREERQRIREFWLQLGEEERRSLLKVEKEAVLSKVKKEKRPCSCTMCGRKRFVLLTISWNKVKDVI